MHFRAGSAGLDWLAGFPPGSVTRPRDLACRHRTRRRRTSPALPGPCEARMRRVDRTHMHLTMWSPLADHMVWYDLRARARAREYRPLGRLHAPAHARTRTRTHTRAYTTCAE